MTLKSLNQTGLGLIENVFALFIFTSVILSLLSVQLIVYRQGIFLEYQMQAIVAANNMAEAIQKNHRLNFPASAYDNLSLTWPTCTTCSAHEVILQEMYSWNQSIWSALPHGFGYICRGFNMLDRTALQGVNLKEAIIASCPNSGNVYTIHIMWKNAPKRSWSKFSALDRLFNTEIPDESLEITNDPNTSASYFQLFVP